MRSEVIVGVVVGLVTASSAPWWWDKLFGPKVASAETPAATALATTVTTPAAVPAPIIVPVPAPQAASPATPEPGAAPALGGCEGKWYVQLGAGRDREGIRGVVEKVRKAGPQFSSAALFESKDGKYRAVLGCFERFEADRLNDELVRLKVLTNTPLTTLGQSLARRVD